MSRASDRAYKEIRSLILSGEVEPGAQLTEEHLAELCGVSRTPVRDAMRRLEAELFIVRSDSQRTFVADWSCEEVEEMFVLRGMLESHAAARAARRLSSQQIDELRALNSTIEAAIMLDRPDVSTFLECNHLFHTTILEAAASPRLTATLGALVEQPVVRRTASRYGPEQLHRSAAEHAQLVAAFEASDADWARAVMLGHIRRAFHAFSDTFTRLSLDRSFP
jgi:DNA-binding GntR family transcriptional regulator